VEKEWGGSTGAESRMMRQDVDDERLFGGEGDGLFLTACWRS
jgi:hypothetical protein